jgi:hypothetical protein
MAGGYVTLSALIAKGFQVEFFSHAEAIMTVDFPSALIEIEAVLSVLTIPVEQLVRGGGGETETTQGLRRALAVRGWVKHNFEIKKLIDDVPRESISHEVDHVHIYPKGTIALEIEWNNKDPFFRAVLLRPPEYVIMSCITYAFRYSAASPRFFAGARCVV